MRIKLVLRRWSYEYLHVSVGQVAGEVRAAVDVFRDTSKLPPALLEAAMFNKLHYTTVFLPALLVPRLATS